MLVRGKLIRKYGKVVMYFALISFVAFVVSRVTAKTKLSISIKKRLSGPLKSAKITEDTSRNPAANVNSENQAPAEKGLKLTNARQSPKPVVKQNESSSRHSSGENLVEMKNSEVEFPIVNQNNAYTGTSLVPEVRHIGFLKVHKAASSTMQNIFFRFGLKRNLTFVFTVHPNYFSRSAKDHLPLAVPKFRKGYDILCNHGIFNHSIYSSFLPNDTFYVGIVRDPLSVFISAVNYYSNQLAYLAKIRGNKLKKLIYHPEIFDKGFYSYTKNVMARDFGFPNSNDHNKTSTKLKELDNIFRLVIVVEHFEESLVLMKRYLNWKMQDILYIPNNVHHDHGRSVSATDLNSVDLETFKIRNKLDYDVYDFFRNKFLKQFESEPDDIQMEVKQFKKILDSVSAFCNSKEVTHVGDELLIVEASAWNEEFSITAKDCWFMRIHEQNFIKILRSKQGSVLKPPPNMRQRQERNRLRMQQMRRMGYIRSGRYRGQRLMEFKQVTERYREYSGPYGGLEIGSMKHNGPIGNGGFIDKLQDFKY